MKEQIIWKKMELPLTEDKDWKKVAIIDGDSIKITSKYAYHKPVCTVSMHIETFQSLVEAIKNHSKESGKIFWHHGELQQYSEVYIAAYRDDQLMIGYQLFDNASVALENQAFFSATELKEIIEAFQKAQEPSQELSQEPAYKRSPDSGINKKKEFKYTFESLDGDTSSLPQSIQYPGEEPIEFLGLPVTCAGSRPSRIEGDTAYWSYGLKIRRYTPSMKKFLIRHDKGERFALQITSDKPLKFIF